MTASRTTRSRNRGRRAEVETDLRDKYNVQFNYHSAVPISEFDIDKSLDNQARFEALDEPTVETYKEAIERGDEFPAVIAYRPGRAQNQKLVIIDGNHRLAAHDREKQPIDVYEIDKATKAQTITLMTFSFNTRHGQPTSEEERIHQALYLMDNSATMPVAAKTVNVSERLLRKAVAKRNADNRARETECDMREWEGLGQAAKSRLLNISTDEGFAGAVHLSYAAGLDANEIFDLAALLNTSKSATKQRALIKSETQRYSDRIQTSGGGVLAAKNNRSGMNPKARLGIALGQVLALPDDLAAIARSYAEAEREDAGQRIMDAAHKLEKLARTVDPELK